MSPVKCVPSNIISSKVTIGYGSAYGLLLLIVSIYSFKYLMKFHPKFKAARSVEKFKMWVLDVWKRRRCYVPMVSHLFDQITDVAVAIQFYYLAQTNADCNELNIWSLFILTVLSMVVYRTISSFLIYKNTQSIRRAVFQMIDLQLFEALYINYICDKTEPSDPQRWITLLESALESSPQTVVQLVFLLKTGASDTNFLITLSLLSSFWTIISKIVSDDKEVVIDKAKRFQRNRRGEPQPMYFVRIIWRVLDVSSHIVLMALLWISVGGLYVAIQVGVEFVVFLYICNKTNRWELLVGLVAHVISVATPQLHQMSKKIFCYRTVTNLIGAIVVSLFGISSVPSGLIIFMWLAIIFNAMCSWGWLDWDSRGFTLEKGKSNSRNLNDMIKSNNEQGILEMQLFTNKLGVYDQDKGMSLLMLAMKLQIPSAVLYILNNVNQDYVRHCDVNGCNMLDYLCWLYSGQSLGLTPQIVYKMYEMDPGLVCACPQNKKNTNILLLHIESEDMLWKTNIKWNESQIKWFNSAFCALNAALIDKTVIRKALDKLIQDCQQFEKILIILETDVIASSTNPSNTSFKSVECNHQPGLLYSFGSSIQSESQTLTFIDNCIQTASQAEHSLFLDDLGRVYSVGRNVYGQLGIVNTDSTGWWYNNASLLTLTTPYRAKQVATGGQHSLVLMENGNVWSFGLNTDGQLGHNDDVDARFKPKMIESIKDLCISYISCGYNHNFLIETTGKVFVFGRNRSGQCGTGSYDYDVPIKVPTEIDLNLNDDEILTVDCGSTHTLILTTNGKVWSVGYGSEGALGHGPSMDNALTPVMIESLKDVRVVDVSCGETHSLCVDVDGVLYSWGVGKYGQLGHGYDYKPTEVKPKMKQILNFIRNKKDKQELNNYFTPKVVECFRNQNIKIVKCNTGLVHSSAIAENGDLYLFGRKDCGGRQTGNELQNAIPVPYKPENVDNISVSAISLGWSQTHVIEGEPKVQERKEQDNQMQRNKSYHVYIKNEELFGDEWLLMDRISYA
eukprot:1009844_1